MIAIEREKLSEQKGSTLCFVFSCQQVKTPKGKHIQQQKHVIADFGNVNKRLPAFNTEDQEPGCLGGAPGERLGPRGLGCAVFGILL